MVKSKSKFSRQDIEPHSIMALIVVVLVIVSFALTIVSIVSAHKNNLTRIETAQAVGVSKVSSQKQKPVTEPQKASKQIVAKKTEQKPKTDPNGCEAKGMYWRADNYQCIPKANTQSSTSQGSGSCEAEIAKYDWNQGVALAVARAESGLNPNQLNDNPATGDYSVGCFQVNIYGANAASRPSEAALKNAATNVAFAYGIYQNNGHSFLGQWGVCSRNVSCY